MIKTVFFLYAQTNVFLTNVLDSYLFAQVWRLRKYVTEKCIAAAKPLWYLPDGLTIEKGGAKRVI